MNEWFIFAIIALILWGLWAFFPKLATQYICPKSVLVFSAIGTIIIAIIILYLIGFKPEIHTKGIIFAIIAGLAGALGALFFFFALSKGKASVVVTMTALYPLITIMLCFLILKEPITLKQGIGMIFALIAIILLST